MVPQDGDDAKVEMSPAHIFRTLEERAAELNIADYSVAQPTMEQIFLGFAMPMAETEGGGGGGDDDDDA